MNWGMWQVAEGVKQLRELVASFEAAFEGGNGQTGEAEFAPVLAAVVDPLLSVCERSAEALAIDAPTRYHAIYTGAMSKPGAKLIQMQFP